MTRPEGRITHTSIKSRTLSGSLSVPNLHYCNSYLSAEVIINHLLRIIYSYLPLPSFWSLSISSLISAARSNSRFFEADFISFRS